VKTEHQKRLLFKLLRANVQLFKTLNERNNGEIDFTLYSEGRTEKQITYGKALEEYLPLLLKRSKISVTNKTTTSIATPQPTAMPQQYVEKEKFFKDKFLKAVGAETLLHTNSSACNEFLENTFKRKDGTVARNVSEFLKAFYLWLYDNKLIPVKISTDLIFETVPKSKRKAFTPEMVNKILTESTGELNIFFRLYLGHL
jgi:hypothetical protein